MKESEFEALFRTFKTPLAELGFSTDLREPYTCRANGPHGMILEFGGDRYSRHLTCSISGPFAHDKRLVFPFVADAIDPAHGKKFRASKSMTMTIELIIEFMRHHTQRLISDYDAYSDRYFDLLRDSGIPDFS